MSFVLCIIGRLIWSEFIGNVSLCCFIYLGLLGKEWELLDLVNCSSHWTSKTLNGTRIIIDFANSVSLA